MIACHNASMCGSVHVYVKQVRCLAFILFLGLGTSLLLISTLPGIFYLLLNPKGFQVSFHVIWKQLLC